MQASRYIPESGGSSNPEDVVGLGQRAIVMRAFGKRKSLPCQPSRLGVIPGAMHGKAAVRTDSRSEGGPFGAP
jgi:hypothetical protein